MENNLEKELELIANYYTDDKNKKQGLKLAIINLLKRYGGKQEPK